MPLRGVVQPRIVLVHIFSGVTLETVSTSWVQNRTRRRRQGRKGDLVELFGRAGVRIGDGRGHHSESRRTPGRKRRAIGTINAKDTTRELN